MKKKYIVGSLLVLLATPQTLPLGVRANEASANVSTPLKTGSVVTYDNIKYKILSLENNKGTVQLGNGIPVQFKADQGDKPFIVPKTFMIGQQEFTVTEIGEEALAYYPDELGAVTYYPSQITLPSTVRIIHKRAFSGSKANTVMFEQGSQLDSIESNAFANSELKHITLPSSLKTIGKRAFDFSERLESLTFEDGATLTSIEDEAFSNLSKLKHITLPSTLEHIGQYPFRYSTGLESVTINPANQTYATEDGVLYTKNKSRLIYYPAQKEGKMFKTLPETKVIDGYAFANQASLEHIVLSHGLEKLGMFAFSGVKTLKNVEMPETLKSVEKLAFFENVELKELNFPNQVNDFERYAVSGLPKLEKVTLGDNVHTLPSQFLSGALDNLREVHINYTGDNFSIQKDSFDVPNAVVFKVKTPAIKDKLLEAFGDKHNVIIEQIDTTKSVAPTDPNRFPKLPEPKDTPEKPEVPKETPEQPKADDSSKVEQPKADDGSKVEQPKADDGLKAGQPKVDDSSETEQSKENNRSNIGQTTDKYDTKQAGEDIDKTGQSHRNDGQSASDKNQSSNNKHDNKNKQSSHHASSSPQSKPLSQGKNELPYTGEANATAPLTLGVGAISLGIWLFRRKRA
ncbi:MULTISPECIES: leucine-rich repeat protein [unclassified Granulicatella]|uniref:leucine-rich repeat protein n=1 Tax=unclassified Granulicatella TaxID=2630493 RepID=UPI0010730D3C|nr:MULTISPECIES: leucine-rich repeat protein [unclassified Granulicatella]MBF0779650.1 leucine-rich repeat protein [Granulicatella sp. 19428wC4_WM01]TFU96306.1 LPXTG cell wall anchor domain-containing protein [Granulicatella sp. WM01]